MNRLDDAMNRLAAELRELEAPQGIELAVVAEFDRVKRRRRARYWTAAVAASVIAIWFVEHRQETPPPPTVAQADQPFVPIPYVLPPAPYERVEVVRMEVPVAALIAAGLSMQTSDPGAQAEADVLVGQDGRPRAVRLVSITPF
jgi:hypothetical protein